MRFRVHASGFQHPDDDSRDRARHGARSVHGVLCGVLCCYKEEAEEVSLWLCMVFKLVKSPWELVL